MSPHEACAPPTRLPWNELLNMCKQQRHDVRTALSLPFSRMSLIKTATGCKLFALGTPSHSNYQTLLSANFSTDSSSPILLEPVFSQDQLKPSLPSAEFSLMCERQRASVVNGITYYTHDPTGYSFLLTTAIQVFRIWDDRLVPDMLVTGFVSDAQICPADTSIVSYVVKKEVMIERDGQLLYQTKGAHKDISNGVPSFITQEELDRFQAVWWSPTKTRLMYERVDESSVRSLSFVCPGKEPAPSMKYPVAGTMNASSELRLIVIQNEEVCDVGLKIPLTKTFPWIEYIPRAGFMNDGKTIWIHAMDRGQMRCALIIIPECSFEGFDEEGPVKHPIMIQDETSRAWTNPHFSILPLDDRHCSNLPHFIYASERASECHLYHVGVTLGQDMTVKTSFEHPITAGAFSVCKGSTVVVDRKRDLVYFLANRSHPTEWNACVAKYTAPEPNLQQLTESGLSVRVERAYPSLGVLPDVGFVCFVTSLSLPHHCRFYSLVHDPSHDLPRSIYAAQIALPGTYIPPTITSNLPKILEYQSRNSGRTHHAMIMKPDHYEIGRSYPVVHYVYGGPGVQVVRNDFSSWVPFQRFTRLGFCVVMVDGRGSSNRGIDFEAPIKNNMGTPEIEDQVEGLYEVARICGKMLDLSRVVIQGWSYGGYMSLLALAKYPNIYRAAVAGGSVTDWRLYDTAYTERYMGYPITSCYDDSSILKLAEQMPDQPGRLFIVHGMIDENVHFRHTEVLIEHLIKSGKPYQLQIFPSERHGIRSHDGAAHFDASMIHFIIEAIS